MGYSVEGQPHLKIGGGGGGGGGSHQVVGRERGGGGGGYFQMPVHYPKYKAEEYKSMPEWKVDCLLSEYGLPIIGSVDQKRKFAMGAFLWPHHNLNPTQM